MCKGEGDAFKAGRDNIDSVTTVVSEGRAKVVSTVPVWIPRETVVGAVKGKTKLAGVVERVSGEVVGKMVESRPSRERGLGAPGAHEVKGEFGVGEKAVPEVSREVGVGGGDFCWSSLTTSLQGWTCEFVGAQVAQATAARENTPGTTMRLGRGSE